MAATPPPAFTEVLSCRTVYYTAPVTVTASRIEREVMALVAAGLSNDEIAEHLVVARATAKTHVSRAMGKLRARHRAQLVTLAYETGLVVAGQLAAPEFGVPTLSSAAA